MFLLRCFCMMCMLCVACFAGAKDQKIIIPVFEGCEKVFDDAFVRKTVTAPPEIQYFDINVEKIFYGIVGSAKLEVSDMRAPFLKKHIASQYTLCTGTSSRAIVTREEGLVPDSITEKLRFRDKHGNGKIVLILEKAKDIEIFNIKP